MSQSSIRLAALTLVVTACSSTPTATSGGLNTGLAGIVRRGPIRPVCVVDQPCDAPFSAGFEVRIGSDVVARFRSDSAGRFTVALSPGDYTVVPDSTAPLLGAEHQAHPVTVDSTGVTRVELDFDTGIR